MQMTERDWMFVFFGMVAPPIALFVVTGILTMFQKIWEVFYPPKKVVKAKEEVQPPPVVESDVKEPSP